MKNLSPSTVNSNQKRSMVQAGKQQNKTAGKKGIKLDPTDSNKILFQMKGKDIISQETKDLIVKSEKPSKNHISLQQKKNKSKKTAQQNQGYEQETNQKDSNKLIHSQHKNINKQLKISHNDCKSRQISKSQNETESLIEQISQEEISFCTKKSSSDNKNQDDRLILQNYSNPLDLSSNQSRQERSLTNKNNQFENFSQNTSQSAVNTLACSQIPKSLDDNLELVSLCQEEAEQNIPNEISNSQNQNLSYPTIQIIQTASETQEQFKIESINSNLKNKWRIKQRFLCDKKKTTIQIFHPTPSSNTTPQSEMDNKDISIELQIQNSNTQIQSQNPKEEINQLEKIMGSSKNTTSCPFPQVIQDNIAAELNPMIQKLGLPQIENSQKNIGFFPISQINNQVSIKSSDVESLQQFKSDQTKQIFQIIQSNNSKGQVNSEKEEEQNRNSKSQQNAFLLKRQDSGKSQMEREPHTPSYPSGGGGDEQETSTNDESNFTSINSSCSQKIQHDQKRGIKNMKNQNKSQRQQQRSSSVKRSISMSSLGKSKSAVELSFSADELHSKDSSQKEGETKQIQSSKHSKQNQIVSQGVEKEDERKSSSQKCFEQLLQLNMKGHNQFTIRDEKGISSQPPELTFSALQGRQIAKDCRDRVAVENKVKRLAVRMKFEQDLLEDEDDSDNCGYGCSDNEDEDDDNSLEDSSESDDDDKGDDDENSSGDDEQSCSVSSRGTLQIKRGTSSNTDLQGHVHSPTHSFLSQQQQHKQQYPFHFNSVQHQSQYNSQPFDCQGGQINQETCVLSRLTEKEFCENKVISQNYLNHKDNQLELVNANQEDEDESAARKKRKKKKSQEQKKKRRNKRKQKIKNKKKDSNQSAQLHSTSTEYGNTNNEQTHKPMREDWQHSNLQLKRLLDENLLEYFTITLSLSAHRTLSIYITDFYQFDEQFDLQSLSYGIDASTILDAKINFIFQIITLQLYPAMTGFFDSLLNSYAMIKQPYPQLNDSNNQKSDFELLTLAFIQSFNEFNETKEQGDCPQLLKEEDSLSGNITKEQFDNQQQKQYLNQNDELVNFDETVEIKEDSHLHSS